MQIQQALGVAHAGALVERALASVASSLVHVGVTQLVVAGGVDTTTALLANTFVWLSEHPDVR